ncbi:IS110 family transposase [Stieleria mannarensis]|uniref:IS110 family transposase n=1 Tax=Stieleria mannarensis TaxID=2755585 RepID=UPI0016030971|nr:IS110 family transposase [Rhodopirellula sp. JC639]
MTATPQNQCITRPNCLYIGLELSERTWVVAFSDSLGRKPSVKSMLSGNFEKLEAEILRAKQRFGLDEDCPVACCYESGRDGFWVHRCLVANGVENSIVDAASIQVNRRKKRAKTDRIDASKIVAALIRKLSGDMFACQMIHIPSHIDEDERMLNREMRILKKERTAHICRIKSYLNGQGIKSVTITADFEANLAKFRTADNRPLMPRLQASLTREFKRIQLVNEQIRDLQAEQANLIRAAIKADAAQENENLDKQPESPSRTATLAAKLIQLCGVGPVLSWTLASELFSWRNIKNNKQLAALVGLVPTPHDSGDSSKEQGISKAGRGELRVLMIEAAWGWLQFQPQSELSKWYHAKFNDGTSRNKKRGIVALARKLLIALRKFLIDEEIPAGAKLSGQLSFARSPSLIPRPLPSA